MSNPDLIETEETVTMSVRRRNLAIKANDEIEQLCTILKDALKDDPDNAGVSGVLSRIRSLSQNAMSAICDEAETTDNLEEALLA